MPTFPLATVKLPVPDNDNPEAPAKIKSSADSSHNIYAPEVAPKNFTSCPVSSTPTVKVPL